MHDEYTPEPWERWNLMPYVPDQRSTPELVTELMHSLPTSGVTEGQVPCAHYRIGRHKKRTRCANRALEGSRYCRQHTEK